MNRIISSAILVLVVPAFALRASACSEAICLGKGMEMRGDFVITVLHRDRPLPSVRVEITKNLDGTERQQFSGTTGADGKLRVIGLPSGEYWIKAELLGIDAAHQCFHVASKPSSKAKRKLKYDWGDLAPATRRITGILVHCDPANGPNPVLNRLRCTPVPIVGTHFKLQHPTNGATYTATSDENGRFSIEGVPSGTYVLHGEGGKTPRFEYDSTDVLVNLSPNARYDTLLLTKREAGGGSCGGTSLDLRTDVGQ